MDRGAKGATLERTFARKLETEHGHKILFRSQRIRFGRIDFGWTGDPLAKVDIVSMDSTGKLMLTSCKCAKTGNFLQHCDALRRFWIASPVSVQLAIYRSAHYAGRGRAKRWVRACWDVKSLKAPEPIVVAQDKGDSL